MSPLAIIGGFVITLSFLVYGIGSISLVRFRIIGRMALVSLTLGTLLDFTAILLMVLGAGRFPISLHGILGSVAFFVMLVNCIWCWNIYISNGFDYKTGNKHIVYTKTAYAFWVVTYFSGSLILMWR